MTMSLLPSVGDGNCYYILTEDCAYGSKYFQAGNMCFCTERSYLRNFADMPPTRFLRVIMLDDSSTVTINVGILQPVREEMAAFLLSISSHNERLNCFLERMNLEAAVQAVPGQRVMVEVDRQHFPGVIRYGEGENRGHSDGSYLGTEYFKCKPNCGVFLPFSRIQFIPTLDNDHGKQKPKVDAEEVVPVKVGDAVSFNVDDVRRKGIAMAVYREGTQWFVKVCPEEEGTTDIFREIPMDCVVKEDLHSQSLFPLFESDMGVEHSKQTKQQIGESGDECEGVNPSLEVNSMVQITLDKGNQVSGIIRWLGYLPHTKHKMAGVELDEDKGVTAGEWLGKYYFHCAPKRGIFVKLQSCQPDVRFQCSRNRDLSLVDYREQENIPHAPLSFPPLRNEEAVHILRGRMKGIQGHCNSCYMDAALFSLFSCTSVLDSMLFTPFPMCDRNVQNILRDEIVNPLRKSGAQKEQDCYCYQIFMDKQEDLVVPDVQQLVEHSFLSSDLKLVEIPSCFIIQMPRFGKEYKMFSKIIPSLELDITDLLLDSGENGFNIPTVTLCPEVAKYLDLPLAMLALQQPRDMDGVAKRLFCDAYMYMYQSKKMALYK
ncbi:hypothetical protein CIB84_006935 [Bambusicola thoracicus]|uniref:ubiquitinyl hydrolase 1 n=1 Tax=Bambusicola thoracicus TaxID=9083 RepID=A0A2P4SYZ2_BAMTH|nr:hypothetical protein CIB84_006935 [Bambusicola thoracicus]